MGHFCASKNLACNIQEYTKSTPGTSAVKYSILIEIDNNSMPKFVIGVEDVEFTSSDSEDLKLLVANLVGTAAKFF